MEHQTGLGHLREGRELRGIIDVAPGTMLMLDEASMLSQPDMQRITGWAEERGAKVLTSGDQERLSAVESGDGMALLADMGRGTWQTAAPTVASWQYLAIPEASRGWPY